MSDLVVHTCKQGPHLRRYSYKVFLLDLLLFTPSRSLFGGTMFSCIFVETVVYTQKHLGIPLPHRPDCTCVVTVKQPGDETTLT